MTSSEFQELSVPDIYIDIERKDAAARESSPGVVRAKGGAGPRSRSGSPAGFDIRNFEKEKSPFLAVKSLLKPVRKQPVPQTSDWRTVKDNLRPRSSPLALQHLNRNKVSTSC